MRRRFSALAATALVASLLATGALPAAAAPAIVPDTATLNTPEDGIATFAVTLSEVPTADVTVAVTSSDTGIVTVSPGSLTFTAANYAAPQTVTVTGIDNTVTDGNQAATIHLSSSGDAAYVGLTASVAVTRVDDEVPGITVTPESGLVTSEDGTSDTFDVVLDAQPTATVTLTVTASDADEATAGQTTLSFLTTNWNTPQTVIVTGVDDIGIDGSIGFTFTLTASNTGGYHDTVIAQVTGANADNDSASLIVAAPEGGLVTDEAGTADTFSVRLSSQPTADVVVTFTSSDTTEATVAPSSLTFGTGTWDTPQHVTVTGVDDGAVDGAIAYTISGTAASADTNYDPLAIGDVAGKNADNDVAAPPPAEDPSTEEADNTFNDVGSLSDETIDAINTLVALEITQGTSADMFSPSQVVSRWQMALFLTRQLVVHGVTMPTATDQGFTDIGGLDAETWNAISQLAALDITAGTGTGTYSPDAGVTRWQMALFMTRVLAAAGVDLPTTVDGQFDDIGDLSPQAQLAIRQLAALGVVMGVGDGAFDPTAEIPRWQMALFIVRTLEAAGVATS